MTVIPLDVAGGEDWLKVVTKLRDDAETRTASLDRGRHYRPGRAATVGARPRTAGAWDESLHPRDESGRFGEKGDDAAATTTTVPDGLPGAYPEADWAGINKLYEAGKHDEAGARMERARAEERAWEKGVQEALNTGQISIEDAHARWGDRVDWLAQSLGANDRGDFANWSPLPDDLWHVTTAAGEVEASGRLMTRDELEMSRGSGLGGGPSNTISFTESPEVATTIRDAMEEARSVAAGEVRVADLLERARSGEGADKPYEQDIVQYWDRGWHTGDPYPRAIEALLTDPALDVPSERLDFYKNFSTWREQAGGPMDPLFFLTDADVLAATPPSDIAIVKVQPVDGALGVKTAALGEWRVTTGRAVNIEAIGQQAALLAAAWDESLHPRDERGRFGDKGDQGASEPTSANVGQEARIAEYGYLTGAQLRTQFKAAFPNAEVIFDRVHSDVLAGPYFLVRPSEVQAFYTDDDFKLSRYGAMLGALDAAQDFARDYPGVAERIESVNFIEMSNLGEYLPSGFGSPGINLNLAGIAESTLGARLNPGSGQTVGMGKPGGDVVYAVMTHELGHALDYYIRGPDREIAAPGIDQHRIAVQGGGAPVSTYALANPTEYFAETFAASRTGFPVSDRDQAMLDSAIAEAAQRAEWNAPARASAAAEPDIIVDDFVGSIVWEVPPARAAGVWDESLHPRDERGRFGEGDGGESPATGDLAAALDVWVGDLSMEVTNEAARIAGDPPGWSSPGKLDEEMAGVAATLMDAVDHADPAGVAVYHGSGGTRVAGAVGDEFVVPLMSASTDRAVAEGFANPGGVVDERSTVVTFDAATPALPEPDSKFGSMVISGRFRIDALSGSEASLSYLGPVHRSMTAAAWDEDLHPRGHGGKFTTKDTTEKDAAAGHADSHYSRLLPEQQAWLMKKADEWGVHPDAMHERARALLDDARTSGAMELGVGWYEARQREASGFAKDLGVTEDEWFGVVAALSPRLRWESADGTLANIELAQSLIGTWQAHPELASLDPAAAAAFAREHGWLHEEGVGAILSDNAANGFEILGGMAPRDALGGPKTRAFYEQMATGGQGGTAVIDVWTMAALSGREPLDRGGPKATTNEAMDIHVLAAGATEDQKKIAAGWDPQASVYDVFDQVIVDLAAENSMSIADTQAVLWYQQREVIGIAETGRTG